MRIEDFYFLYSLIILFIINSCANIVPPSGGPKDIDPPKLISSQNKVIDENKIDITLEFNERIEENYFKQNFYISPPINNFDYQIRGRFLDIKIKDPILNNLKYIICLDNCIKDATEGNILSSLSYEISNKDSSIKFYDLDVVVKNAYTGNPEKNQWILIYSDEVHDSLIFKRSPQYISRCDDKGIALFNNLVNDLYKIFSVSGQNYEYNIGDLISFSNIETSPIEDSCVNLFSYDPTYYIDSINPLLDSLIKGDGSLSVSTDITNPYIVQILENDKIIIEEKFINTSIFNLDNLKSGSYTLKIIIDENNNGRWDTGNFKNRKQPEKVFIYPEIIIMRSNWDIELIWNVIQ